MRKGSALIELALSLVVLVMMGAGAFQFGYQFWARDRLQSAVAAAARYASRMEYQGRSAECAQRGFEAARRFAVYGDPGPHTAGASPAVPGLRPSHIAVDVALDAKGVPDTITLSVRGFELEAVFSRYRLNGSPSAVVPFQGGYLAQGCPQ